MLRHFCYAYLTQPKSTLCRPTFSKYDLVRYIGFRLFTTFTKTVSLPDRATKAGPGGEKTKKEREANTEIRDPKISYIIQLSINQYYPVCSSK